MTKKLSLNDWLFALGIYPSFNAIERFSLFNEMVMEFTKECSDNQKSSFELELHSKMTKRLSHDKKASFASFLSSIDLEKEKKKYMSNSVSWVHILSKDYPSILRHIYSPPVILFYQGNLELIEEKTWLGIVGARINTSYGLEVVEQIVSGIINNSDNKIGIVSGLAKGIDRKAHIETIKNKGKTIGVIGTGLDLSYPYTNQSLQQQIGKEHLLLSEYPLNSKPLKFHFPERNRIISGLSRGVLVVEAKKRSGSLITAYNALDENRDVFAIPGSIFEKNNEGCHKLIELGATLVQSDQDILKEWFLL